MTHSQLLTRLKSESKYKTTKGGRVRVHSLAHNTLKGRGACWSSEMGLGKVDKLHSLTRACTQPTQGGQCIVGTLLVLERDTGNTDTQDSPRPGLGESHHLSPLQYTLHLSTGPTSKWLFSPGTPEIAPAGTSAILEPHNFASRPQIEVQSKAKLYLVKSFPTVCRTSPAAK